MFACKYEQKNNYSFKFWGLAHQTIWKKGSNDNIHCALHEQKLEKHGKMENWVSKAEYDEFYRIETFALFNTIHGHLMK